jgi:hypothetical protein
MNTVENKESKIWVIREYNDSDENISYMNDILEYLYDIRDGLKEGIEKRVKNAQSFISNNDTYRSYRAEKYYFDKATNLKIQNLPDNLNAINTLIDEVNGSDYDMYAVVWDKSEQRANVIENPRLRRVLKTYIPVYDIRFDRKNLFHLGELHNANGISITDNDEALTIMTDYHLTEHLDGRSPITDPIFGIFENSSSSVGYIEKQLKRMYVHETDEDVDRAKSILKKINEEVIQCKDCGEYFILSKSHRDYYLGRGLSIPKRCSACRLSRYEKKAKEAVSKTWTEIEMNK